jgi:branched-chain amino acid transport system substrate-binding protein
MTRVATILAAAATALFAGALLAPAQAQNAKCGLNTGQAATGEPIPIGAIVSRTGPDDFSGSAYSAEAYFKCVNANGGINGRPVNYIIGDDQWNPEIAAQLAAKQVNDDKVVAMAGSSSFVECGANAALYEKEDLVSITGTGVPRECFTAKNIAPVNAGPRLSSIAAADYTNKTTGAKSFVCIAPNIPNVGPWSCGGVEDWAKLKGFTASTIVIDPASADFTSIALQAASSNPDSILLGLPKGLTLAFLVAAEEQGLIDKITFTSAAAGYAADVPGALGPAWSGKFSANMEFARNLDDTSTPDNANWLAVMDAYAAADAPRDTFAQSGYLTARLVTEALLALDPATIDRATVTAALKGVRDFQSDILCAPWYYGADAPRHNANNVLRMAVTDGDTWKVVSECTPVDDPELADIRAYEEKMGMGR